MELLRFQAAEITDAGIIPGEDESLEQERLRLKHAESLSQSALTAIDSLYRADGAILERLGVIHKDIQKAADLEDALQPVVQDLANHLFGLEDVTEKLQSYQRGLDTDSGSLDSVEYRLDLINKLKRKYGKSLTNVLSHLDAITCEIAEIDNMEDNISGLKEKLSNAHNKLTRLAKQLSEKRQQTAKSLSKKDCA